MHRKSQECEQANFQCGDTAHQLRVNRSKVSIRRGELVHGQSVHSENQNDGDNAYPTEGNQPEALQSRDRLHNRPKNLLQDEEDGNGTQCIEYPVAIYIGESLGTDADRKQVVFFEDYIKETLREGS